jgi:hypothetical protein
MTLFWKFDSNLNPLYGMPSAARAWHTTISAFLAKEGCAAVGLEKSDKEPTNKICRRVSSEQRLRTRSCHE